MVRGERHVGLAGEQLDRLGQVAGPDPRVADLRAAQGQQVVQVVGGVLGHAQRPLVREIEVHLRRALGAGRELEDDADPVQDLLLPGAGDGAGRRDQAGRAGRPARAQPDPQRAGRALGQADSGVVVAAAQHRRPRRRRSPTPRAPGNAPARGSGPGTGIDHAQHPAEVIQVGVRVDHGRNGTVAPVSAVQGDRRGRDLRRDQRVDHDDAMVAFDQRHVRHLEPADLVDPVASPHTGRAWRSAEPAATSWDSPCPGSRRPGNPSESISQTTRPSAALMTIGSSVPRKPRSALTKSRRSLKSAPTGPVPATCSDISLSPRQDDGRAANPLSGPSNRLRHILTLRPWVPGLDDNGGCPGRTVAFIEVNGAPAGAARTSRSSGRPVPSCAGTPSDSGATGRYPGTGGGGSRTRRVRRPSTRGLR